MIPLKIQKILLFIPIVNAFVPFLFYFNFMKKGFRPLYLCIGIFIGFFSALIPNVIFYFISCLSIPEPFASILDLVSLYVVLFCLGGSLILYQKKLGIQ